MDGNDSPSSSSSTSSDDQESSSDLAEPAQIEPSLSTLVELVHQNFEFADDVHPQTQTFDRDDTFEPEDNTLVSLLDRSGDDSTSFDTAYDYNQLDENSSSEGQANESSHTDQVCKGCGSIHSLNNLLQALSQPAVPSKKTGRFQETQWHNCHKIWPDLTIRLDNLLFVCLTCYDEYNMLKQQTTTCPLTVFPSSTSPKPLRIKHWCFSKRPLLGNVKRHYRQAHKNHDLTTAHCIKDDSLESLQEYTKPQFNYDVLEWIIYDNHEFSLVEQKKFRAILVKLNPSVGSKLLKRTQIVEKYLPLLTAKSEAKVSVFYLS